MKQLTGSEIRKEFLSYFASKGHKEVKSSNLIPAEDPTLMFTNAGMVQFKDVFIGKDKREYSRAVTSQKCLRVSGKHNDLEEVGRTNRHNTFFEMLGNFSFGDYFKEDAIKYAWEFLTERMQLPKEMLWASVYEKDDDAAKIWMEVTDLPESRIVPLGEADNFWSMGAVGPCGPCSEIYIDHGEARGCNKPSCKPGCDCERYEEIWNLVFMQYNRDADGNLTELPNPSIDTGMGLERLASLLQGVNTNFDTDLIRPIIATVEDVLGRKYGQDKESDVSFRVIGDHIRSAAFLITEGVLPSNDDRGYVLRRIMRRAMRHGNMLGATSPFLHKVVGRVINEFAPHYPELKSVEATMARIIEVEELRFSRTLDAGLKILNDLIKDTKTKCADCVDGSALFKLYDTYGFPIDLACDVITDAGLKFDKCEFDKELSAQREMARSSAKTAAVELPKRYLPLKDMATVFTGYDGTNLQTEITAILKGDEMVEQAAEGDEVELMLAATPFYGESGGQMGDVGLITSGDNMAEVLECKKPTAILTSHKVKVAAGVFKRGDSVTAEVNKKARDATRQNHTATHLLHAALKEVLGEHVKQAGSSVSAERLRFDFSHYAGLSRQELAEVERIVNQQSMASLPITTTVMSREDAIEAGATALFGEKYGAEVRVVEVPDFSKELCGGTHADNTGQLGLIKIVNETGVAAGVRRLEALSGNAAYMAVTTMQNRQTEIAESLKCQERETVSRLKQLIEKNKELEKQLKKIKSNAARGAGEADAEERDVAGVKVLAQMFDGADIDSLRNFVDETKNRLKSCIVMAGTADAGKVSLIVGVTKDLTGKYKAGALIKEAAAIVGGSGGGRPDMAQAGGTDESRLQEAVSSIFNIVEKL